MLQPCHVLATRADLGCSAKLTKVLLLLGSEAVAELRQRVEDLHKDLHNTIVPLVKVIGQLIDWTEDVASQSSMMEFKDDLIERYSKQRGGRKGPLLYCMLTHEFLPSRVVVGSHIWKRAWWK